MSHSPLEHALGTPARHGREAGPEQPGGSPREDERAATLGLCDLSGLPKIGVAGPQAAAWLASQGLVLPETPWACTPLPEGGWVARWGDDDYLVELIRADRIDSLHRDLRHRQGPQLIAVDRADAGIGICGARSAELLAQTCALDLCDPGCAPPGRLIMTRLAGVDCAVLALRDGGPPRFRIWCDPSYAVYLFETLLEIAGELGGGLVPPGRFDTALRET